MTKPSSPSRLRRLFSLLLRLVGVGVVASIFGVVTLVTWLESGVVLTPDKRVVDVTQLIAIDVERIATPHTIDEVRMLLARYDGPVSIGGGRFSMGGQIATDGTLFIDMREMDDVLQFDQEARTVRVEAGITWRKLIESIDEHDLSVKIMQSYANFTVGGSLSVNAHGRYTGMGPVVHSVRSIDIVLADGSLVRASRDENAEIFYAAAGGYGAIGVIVAVELDLAENTKLERTAERLPVEDFLAYFIDTVKPDDSAVFFNADLYPPDYDEMVSILFSETDRAVTVTDRLQPGGASTKVDRMMYWWVSEGPLGKKARSEVIDRMRLGSKPVVYRNYEATYDVAGLEPGSRKKSTYVLQEYFIPVGHFDRFVPKMRDIFQKHDVNVVNVSIRHASAEPESMLTWAPEECFAFVVYYKMGVSQEAWDATGDWTREMSDAILSEHGTWYLPYQIHATPAQFEQGYPRHGELFALKKALDPDYTFRNRLWDRYLPPTLDYGMAQGDETAIRAKLAARESWKRPEDQTFLTLPEWSIVYSADETGAFLANNPPSAFPWFGAIAQFWTDYRAVWAICRKRYDFNTGYHAMIGVIGVSYTVEYGVKGLYENSIGRLFEWVGGPERPAEEDFYATVTSEYGAFTHHTPWYAFPFAERRADLSALPVKGSWLRRTERWAVTGIEFTAKSWWAGAIAWANGTAYAPEAGTLEAWIRPRGAEIGDLEAVEVLEDLGNGNLLVRLPRYEPFTALSIELASRGVEMVEVAGGQTILVQLVVPTGWDDGAFWGDELVRWDILTVPGKERVALEVPIRRLDEVLPALGDSGVVIEHLYDF